MRHGLRDEFVVETTYHTFVSHSSVDREDANRVVAYLRDHHSRVFYSHDCIAPSQHFPSALSAGLNASQTLVLLVSEASMASNWVREEVDAAVTERMNIVPVFLQPVEFEAFHPIAIHLKYLHRLDLYGGFEKAMTKLLDIIGVSEAEQNEAVPSPSLGPAPPPASGTAKPAPPPKATGKPTETAKKEKPADAASQDPKPPPKRKPRIDPEALIERLSRDVDRGDREAAYFLSRLYSSGLYVDRDDGRAVRYLQLSSQGARGMPEAMHDLAEMYRLGQGVGRNPVKAISLHEGAAKRGYAPSFYRLGRIYQQGKIAPGDHARAYRRFSVAAELGYAPAYFRLAEAYLTGTGTGKDPAKAYECTVFAAEKHYPPALNLMGRLYRRGIFVEQDDALACDWYEKAMSQGSPEGAYNLATMYRRGLGRPQDELVARRHFEAASRLLSGADPAHVLREASILVETEGGGMSS